MTTRTYDLIIGLLARDCEQQLRANIERIAELQAIIPNSAVVAVENDSQDGTKAVLQSWAESSAAVHIDSFTLNDGSSTSGVSQARIERMAYCRNRLLQGVEQCGESKALMLIDIDIEWFSPQEVAQAFSQMDSHTGAFFANGRLKFRTANQPAAWFGLQYDTYAYLAEGETMEQLKQMIDNRRANAIRTWRGWQMNRALLREDRLACQSAFGGLALYNRSAISGLQYNAPRTPCGNALSEHTPFNVALRQRGYQNYILRNLHACYGTLQVNQPSYWAHKHFPLLTELASMLKHF